MNQDNLASLDQPAVGISPLEWKARVELAASYRLLAAFGFHDLTYNHLSARVPDAPDRYLTKGQDQLFEHVTASSLLLYSLAGEKLCRSPGKVPPGGLVIHGGVLSARPDLMAAFHTHSPASMGVSAQACGLLMVSQHSMLFHDRLSYHSFEGFEFEPGMKDKIVRDLGSNKVMLMRNHGVLVCGRTVPEAYFLHHYLEMACRAQVAALTAGGPSALVLPSAEICEHGARQMEARGVVTAEGRDWPALMRLAGELAPGFDS
ncbi:class II aldolase/adducin family protein [soil metagenome]